VIFDVPSSGGRMDAETGPGDDSHKSER
jgi:hypothetical protein